VISHQVVLFNFDIFFLINFQKVKSGSVTS